MPRKRTHDEFVSILADINQDIVVLGHYENANTPVEVECLICGHRWSPRPASLTNIRSCCPVCAVKKRGEKQRKGLSELQTEMMVKGITEIEVAGDVIGYGTKTSFRCRVCGNLWKATPTSILSGRGCPKCSGHHRRSQEEFVSDVLAVNPDVEVIGEFVNRKTPVEVRCKKCGRTWSPKASSLLLGHGCRVCAGNLPLSHEAFIERLSSINPNVEILGKYQSRNKKIKARCRKCGAVWSPTPNNLLNGSTCLRCSYEKRAQEKKKNHEDFLAELR